MISNCFTGCFKVVIVLFLLFLIFTFGALSAYIDLSRIAEGKEPYFFTDPGIESYDESIFTDVEASLLNHYESKKQEILDLEKDLVFHPNLYSLSVKYKEGSEIDISASYIRGSFSNNKFNYKSEKNNEKMDKAKLTSEQLDEIKIKLKRSGCFSFETRDAIKLGFKNKKEGTFYYRFASPDDNANLQDSCLIKKVDDQIYLQYIGRGRGPNCIKNKNAKDFDDRNYVQKWIDLIRNGKIVLEK